MRMLRHTDFNRVILCLLKVIINLSFYFCTPVFKILNVFCKFIRIAFDSSGSFGQIWNLEGEAWLFSIDGVRSTVLEQYMHVQKPGRVIQRPSDKPSLGTGSLPWNWVTQKWTRFSAALWSPSERAKMNGRCSIWGTFLGHHRDYVFLPYLEESTFKPIFIYLLIYIICLSLYFNRTLTTSHMLRLWSEKGDLHLIGRENEAE